MYSFIDHFDANERFIFTVSLIFVIVIINKIISMILHKSLNSVVTYYKIKTTISYFFIFFVIFSISFIWVGHTGNMSTYLGLLSAGVAIALRDIFLNIVSWLLIVWKKPFSVGDRIQVGAIAGDVIDQKVFHFTLMEIRNWVDGDQSTGRIVHVPNYKVFSDTVANYSKGFQYIWNELNVTLTLESNWQKAKTLLQTLLDEHSKHLSQEAQTNVRDASRKYMIYYNKLTPTVYTSVKSSSIQLSLRYLCEPRSRRNSEQELWEKILTLLKEEQDIVLK